MLDSITSAAGAYKNIAQLTSSGSATLGAGVDKLAATTAQEPKGFGQMVNNFISQVEGAGQKADTQSAMAVQGKANMVDMVTAISESEVALQTLVSFRDRAISAYEEIMRMPI